MAGADASTQNNEDQEGDVDKLHDWKNIPWRNRDQNSRQTEMEIRQKDPRLSDRNALRGARHPSGLFCRLHKHRCAVGQNFGDALHHFCRIVTRAHNRIPTQFRRMNQH